MSRVYTMNGLSATGNCIVILLIIPLKLNMWKHLFNRNDNLDISNNVSPLAIICD